MFFVVESDERPQNWARLSTSTDWEGWLGRNIPLSLHDDVRRRLGSNLKHVLVGLELKAALIDAHASGQAGEPRALFEPYFQNFIFEFCLGAFSILEGLGAAQFLHQTGDNGVDGNKVARTQWRPALCAVYDPTGDFGLDANVTRTAGSRDKLHQDQVGLREEIDWHAFSYDAAFVPAAGAIRTLLRREANFVPDTSNLRDAQ